MMKRELYRSSWAQPSHGGRRRAVILFLTAALALNAMPRGLGAETRDAAPPVEDRYWQLGTGLYFGGMGGLSELDVARFDWLYLCFGNIGATEETTQRLNRLLAINPELKVMIRLWPIGGLGDCKENRFQATFLHYLYTPGVKEKLLERIHEQTRVVLDHISKPENVLGLTFLEELPCHFSAVPFRRNADGDEVGWCMERFRKEIEAERGVPLKWDDDTRRWWIGKWIQVMDEIHAAMKTASDGRLVIYYQQTNHKTLDMVPDGTPLNTSMLMPLHWADIVKPGKCDGLFAYPNNRIIWEEHYERFARKNNWLLFSQLSHPSGMRLAAWAESLDLAKRRFPQNLGYFFYCAGDCAQDRAWNADPGIPPGREWNTPRVSARLHMRRHLAGENVGMDRVRQQPPLRLYVDLPLERAQAGGFMAVRAIVENTRDPSFFLDPREAVVTNVELAVALPEGFDMNPAVTCPASISIGPLPPGGLRVVTWWISVGPAFDGRPASPFVFTARADGVEPTVVSTDRDLEVPFAQPHEIGIPGTRWMEIPYRMGAASVSPRIVVECLRGPVRYPGVGDEAATVTYAGVLQTGMRLVMDPDEGARLFMDPMIDDDGRSRADENDPSGFRCFSDGYMVHRLAARGAVDPAVPLRLRISGQGADDGQSQVLLRFAGKKGTMDKIVLVNRFGTDWREIEEEVSLPEGARSLEAVFLYRFQSRGKVWYGPIRIERADARPEGLDVSERLRGSFPVLERHTFSLFHYTDDDPPAVAPRVRVRLDIPEA